MSRAASYQSLRKSLLPEFEQAQLQVDTSDGNKPTPSAPASPNLIGPDFDWMILKKAEDRLVLQCCKDGKQLTFVPETSQVYTSMGQAVRDNNPKPELIAEYLSRWYRVPDVKPEAIQKIHPDWRFNRDMASFFEERHGIVLFHYGYRVKYFR